MKIKDPKFSLALVTGASSGIGMALCRLLASKHISLMITGRDINRLNALAEELKPLVSVVVFPADMTDELGLAQIVDSIHTYQPDLLINNAGFALYGEALSYKTNEQLEILHVNATAVLKLTLEGAKSMVSAEQKGVILNVSSAAAMQVFPSMAVYAASKAFVNKLSESLDFEMRPRGVRVLTSCPGMVATAFSSRAAGQDVVVEKAPVMSAEFAAEEIWRQIEKEKRLHVFDWKIRLTTYASYLIPTTLIAKLLSKIIESRHLPRSLILPKKHPPKPIK